MRPGSELVTESRLIGQLGVAAFVPYRTVQRNWKDRKVYRRQALIPGYVFVHIDLGERGQLVQARAVERLLRFGSEYATLESEEIASLRRISEAAPNPETWERLAVGQSIRLDEGPWAGCVGEVVERHQGRYFTVRLPMLGRQVAVRMEVVTGQVSLLPRVDARMKLERL